jgi:uncharacterized protein
VDDGADWILFFMMCSFAGWVLETVYASMKKKSFVNRGFLNGFFCPIYGFAAVLIVQLSGWAEELGDGAAWAAAVFGFAAILTVTCVEYVTGWILLSIFKRRWWDYSDNLWHIDGHICVKFSLLWGMLAFIFAELIYPLAERLIAAVPSSISKVAVWFILLYFLADAIASVRKALHERGPLPFTREEVLRLDEYEACVRELLDNDEVLSMERFIHHHQTNCLHHSIQVSYISFTLCKRLHLDYRSAARGGLLHDFFLYDWREHRPDNGRHAFSHPRTALRNAERHFHLNQVEKDIIEKHMWPLALSCPRYKESFIVMLADRYCTVKEYSGRIRALFRPFPLATTFLFIAARSKPGKQEQRKN